MSSSQPRDPGAGWLEPIVVGLAVALLVFWAAGWSLTRPPAIPDEAAYLLQAGIFAHGRWISAAPALPEFFEQLHVLVTPVLASKYPPGQSLILTPFAWAGVPGLAPILLSGVTAALLYALARRLADRWVALLAVLWWLAIDQTIYAGVMYMSEVTTAALWLLAWWSALRWRDSRSLRALALCAFAVSWTLITRPLTGVALAVPLMIVFAIQWRRHPRARPVVVASAVMAGVLMILPIHNANTTGSWRESALSLYTRQYIPFDVPGLGVTGTRALRPLPPDLASSIQAYYLLHRDYHLASLPGALLGRLHAIVDQAWGGWRIVLALFAIVGLASAGPEARFGAATAALLVLLYLCYAHPPNYTLYYLEADPVLAFLTALGVMRLSRLRALWVAVFAVAAVLAARRARSANAGDIAYQSRFNALIAPLNTSRAIVFVHYAPSHNANQSLVANTPDERTAPVWIVHDRGQGDARLQAIAPDRASYRFDEATWTLTPLTAPELSARPRS